MPVPFSTCTARSSIVTVTRSGVLTSRLDEVQTPSRRHLRDRRMRVHLDRREHVIERRRAAEGTAAAVDVGLELVTELVHVARDDDRVRVPERAQALAVDAVAHVEQQVELALARAPVLELAQDGGQPPR